MGQSRLNLHSKLVEILGTSHVYFQPPANLTMEYPCIVYKRSNIRVKFADNIPYFGQKQYMLTAIDSNPDSLVPDKLALLPQCIFDRNFVTDNLNHDVFFILF